MSAYVARTDQEKMSLSIARGFGIGAGFSCAALTNVMVMDGHPLWAIFACNAIQIFLVVSLEIAIRAWLDERAEKGERQ